MAIMGIIKQWQYLYPGGVYYYQQQYEFTNGYLHGESGRHFAL
jgi:hypothetical protein